MNEFLLLMVTVIFISVIILGITYLAAEGLEEYPILQMMCVAFVVSVMVGIYFKLFESIDIVFKFT